MAASPEPARNILSTNTSSVMFDPTAYAALMRRQFETAVHLTTAWTTAMSGMFLPQSPAGGRTEPEKRAEPPPGRRLHALPAAAAVAPPPADTGTDPTTVRYPQGGMLGWLTDTPPLQTNLFDEAMVLLVDEDIKTAS